MSKDKAIMLALFGPDGSGKSTVANVLEKHWKNAGVSTLRMHWRPGLLPYRSRIRTCDSREGFTDPCKTKLRRGPKAWLIFLYVVVDFLLGYIFIIRPKLKRGTIVIYERYYYDILIDQKRYGLSIPASVRRGIAGILIPAPDIIFLLDAPAEVLYARKQELTCDEIERQRKQMKKNLCRFDNCHIVNVELDDPDKIYMEIKGREVYQQAVRKIVETVDKCLDKCGLDQQDVGEIIFHQMNARIIESVAKRLELPDDKVFINISKYGNTSAASVPIAFDECYRQGRIKEGDVVIFVAFGAGLTWGANVIQF